MANLFERLNKIASPPTEAVPPTAGMPPTEEATAATAAANLFERLNIGRPPPTEEAIKQLREDAQIEKLLDWVVNHWAKDTVTAREICIYGPNATRDKKTTLSLAAILVEQGWLVPITTRRRDMWEWKIVRGANFPRRG